MTFRAKLRREGVWPDVGGVFALLGLWWLYREKFLNLAYVLTVDGLFYAYRDGLPRAGPLC